MAENLVFTSPEFAVRGPGPPCFVPNLDTFIPDT